MLEKFKNIVIIVLMILCALGFYQVKKLEKEQNRLLVENVNLNEKIKQIVTISNGKVKIVYRDKDKVIIKYVYLSPSSGGATTVITSDDDTVAINNEWYGFTFTPFVGMTAGKGLGVEAGARFFYLNHFGFYGALNKLGENNVEPALGVDYHIQWGFLQNSAVGVFYSPSNIGLGFHSFL